MKIKLLTNSWQWGWGAMFSRPLGDTVLIFIYPFPERHIFHTAFCPPLRIMALDERGQVVYNQVKRPFSFAFLPSTRLIIEADPSTDLPPVSELLALVKANPAYGDGNWDENVSVDGLVFALVAHAVADMRRVNEAVQRSHAASLPAVLRKRFSMYERGQLAASAETLLDFAGEKSIPPEAVSLSRQLLSSEKPYLDELFVAAAAAMPWKIDFPNYCLRCGRVGVTWRSVISGLAQAPPVLTWRYTRPENNVPLCHKCVDLLNWNRDEQIRRNLALGLWGPRFEAFLRWHNGVLEDSLPQDWDCQEYPLWPRQFGGATWGTGSGSIEHAYPRPPDRHIVQTAAHKALLSELLFPVHQQVKLKGRLATSPFGFLVKFEEKENIKKGAAL